MLLYTYSPGYWSLISLSIIIRMEIIKKKILCNYLVFLSLLFIQLEVTKIKVSKNTYLVWQIF